ncbi:MAG TPA: hypothetical protein VFI11_10730 [Anaerolineales bacterium]|nr:hypothetical protein [Anaerolineales bacterium]
MKAYDRLMAVLMVVLFLAVSVPYQFQSAYWAETWLAWGIYLALGTMAAVYVAYLFLQSLRSLIEHDERTADHG